MTALERLREWFNGDKRPEKSAWITGDTVETRAILELADRLEMVEQDCGAIAALRRYKFDPNLPPITPLPMPAATESPPQPFRITGRGRYRMRNGRFVNIRATRDGEFGSGWDWTTDDVFQTESAKAWRSDRHFDPFTETGKCGDDIIAGPLADDPPQEPETATLMSEMLQVLKGVRPLVLSATAGTLTEEEAIRTTWLGHLDAAITKAGAIVKAAEPVRETKTLRLGLFPNGEVRCLKGNMPSGVVAIVEQVTTFTYGEGLEAGQ